MTSLAPALEGFFTQRLLAQRRASPNTVAAYRDTFRLLLRYMQEPRGPPPASSRLRTWTRRGSRRSLTTSNKAGGPKRGRATHGSLRCTHCSATWPSSTPSTQRSSNVCWPYL